MFAERVQDADECSRRRDTARGRGNRARFAEDGEECDRVRAGSRFGTRTGVRFCISYEEEEESRKQLPHT